jgi:hypothetical protein
MSRLFPSEFHLGIVSDAILASKINLAHRRRAGGDLNALPGAICWLKCAKSNLRLAAEALRREAKEGRR